MLWTARRTGRSIDPHVVRAGGARRIVRARRAPADANGGAKIAIQGGCRRRRRPHVAAMLRIPTTGLTDEAKANLDRFAGTAAAREMEDDPRTWTVIEWTRDAGPPIRVHLRDEGGDVIDFIMDDAGVWQLWREPIDPKISTPSDLPR